MEDNKVPDNLLVVDERGKLKEKRFRKRKKKLYKVIREQMEFYFSDSNLSKDKFMSSVLSQSADGYVDLNIFLKFNKIKILTTDLEELAQALSTSDVLELNETSHKIRRITPVQQRNDFDESTIYIENLPYYADHEWLKNIFSAYGHVTYVNLPKYKTTKQHKGFAFVEFDSPNSAKLACGHFGASIEDFKELEIEKNSSIESRKRPRSPSFTHIINDVEEEEEEEEEEDDFVKSPKRRKKTDEENSGEATMMVTDLKETSTGAEADIVRNKKKKKRKRQKKSKQKITAETNQLRVLSKLQWKSLRNRYLTLQKNNMTSLKKSLMLLNQNLPAVSEPQKKILNESNTGGKIIKLITTKDILDIKQFKESALTIANVQYIDNHSSEEEIFIRCENTSEACQLLQSEFLNTYGEAYLLEGEEEKSYLDKIEEDRRNKYNSKNRVKKRGREKIIARADQLLEKPKPKHIRFDDE